MREIKLNYIYGIKGKPETYFSKTFTLEQIENGEPINEVCDSPLLKDYLIIAKRQWTGLKDKNGKEIYEGDILAAEPCNIEVVFDEENLAFMIDTHFDGKTFVENGKPWYSLEGKISDYEVIGNIYKNPELLEGK